MVTTVYCLIVKFPTLTGIRYIKADQAMAQQCHIQSLHLRKQVVPKPDNVVTSDILAIERNGSMITLDGLDSKEDRLKPKSVEQTEAV